MGKPTLVGDIGAGQTNKLVKRVIVAINIAAVAEGLLLRKKVGWIQNESLKLYKKVWLVFNT